MPTPFPGMDPYLEREGLWSEIHTHLIVDFQYHLTSLLRPKYRAAIICRELSREEEEVERHLEIRDIRTREAVTVIAILSLMNKTQKQDHQRYARKRRRVLNSATSLVEIDLLRAGTPFTQKASNNQEAQNCDYRIMVSRSWQRPQIETYFFALRQPIPTIPIPLRCGEIEPTLPINEILHKIYEQIGYDMEVDYSQPAIPPLSKADAAWAATLFQ